MVGSMDIYNYAYSYEAYNIREYLKYDTAEIGFQAYTVFLKLFSNNRYFYFFITAFVLGFLQLFSSWNLAGGQREFYLLAFIVLCRFYLLDFIVLKQLMCIGFVWLSISYYYHSEKKKALFFLLISFTFHRSAFILIPLYFLLEWNISFKKTIIVYAALLLLIVSGLFFYVEKALFYGISFVPYLSKASVYWSGTPYYKWIYLIEIPIVIAVLFFIKKTKLSARHQKILFNIVFVYGLIVMVSIVQPILIRIAWFFFIGFAYALACVLYSVKNKKIALYAKALTVIYFSMIFFRFLFFYYGGDMLPYKSIFDKFDRKGQFDYMEYRKN